MTEPPTDNDKTSPPKRDKFASMAAAAAAPKRDKLASMAAAVSSPPKVRCGDKLANMAAASSPQKDAQQEKQKQQQQQAIIIKQRMKQRNQVLQDLRQAEGWTFQLVHLASQTAKALEHVHSLETKDVSLLSRDYQETLTKIHSILSPHASLVVPYENHSTDKKKEPNHTVDDAKAETNESIPNNINMYASRVETRLAEERRSILQELLRLEQQEEDQHAEASTTSTAAKAGEKRKR